MSGVTFCPTRSVPRVDGAPLDLLCFMGRCAMFFLLTDTIVCVTLFAEIVVVLIMLT